MAKTERVNVLEAARAALAARAGGPAVVIAWRADGGGDGRRTLVHAPGSEAAPGDAAPAPGDDPAVALARDLFVSGTPAGIVELEDGTRLYAELHRSTARLFVVGAGHIGLALARLGVELGFDVVVLDDREEFATDERFPDASDVRRVDFGDPFRDLAPGPADYVVLVTRAHRYDYDCLLRLVDTDAPPRYIGMVGSRRRVRAAFGALLEAGIPRERLAAVHAPIGVDIGAETPEEIALSIAAEVVAARRGVAAGGSLRDRERVVERWL